MNASDMLDYALGQLTETELERVNLEASADPSLRARLDLLRERVALCLDAGDEDEIEPPYDLTARALAAAAGRRRQWSARDLLPVRVPFRWADVAVAASILIAGLLTLIPPLHRSRVRMDQAACAFNLQQIGVGLAQYAATNRSLPYPQSDGPAPYVGVWAPMLLDSGHLRDRSVLDCPGNGSRSSPHQIPELEVLIAQELAAPLSARRGLCGDYAFSQGYLSPSGEILPPSLVSAAIPILADLPPHDDQSRKIFEGNSPNHGGHGQNVLFLDGHVVWLPSRRAPSTEDEDIFASNRRRAEPGAHVRDASLAPGCFRLDGR